MKTQKKEFTVKDLLKNIVVTIIVIAAIVGYVNYKMPGDKLLDSFNENGVTYTIEFNDAHKQGRMFFDEETVSARKESDANDSYSDMFKLKGCGDFVKFEDKDEADELFIGVYYRFVSKDGAQAAYELLCDQESSITTTVIKKGKYVILVGGEMTEDIKNILKGVRGTLEYETIESKYS